jgi:Family of unknown function (DUF6343)
VVEGRRNGSEPMSARSAYALRTVLAAAGGAFCAAAAVLFAVLAADGEGATGTAWAAAAVFGLFALAALADLVVIRRRQRTRA